MPEGLHHVEIYVRDLGETMTFWSWLLPELGYELFQSWEEGQSWKLGDTYLVFVQTVQKHQTPAYHRCRSGLNHLAFHGRSRAHVDALTEALRERGATVLYEDRHPYASGPDYYAVFFEDPNRMKVEVVAPEATPAS